MAVETGDIRIRVSEDAMQVLFDGNVPESDVGTVADHSIQEMKTLDVAEIPKKADLEEVFTKIIKNRGSKIKNLVLVKGQEPTPPKHEQVEWARDFFNEDFVVDEKTGAADYRQRKGDPSVAEGELLCTTTYAKEGEDGLNVFGKKVPAEKPKRARVKPGKNIDAVEKDEGIYHYAKCAGRIRYVAGALDVDKVFVIAQSVGLETGDIRHPGGLVIRGDVLAGSHIEAEGDIEIKGIVEPSDIKCGGSLYVTGGITGTPERSIEVAGNISARFILEANVTAGGDILVTSEIVHAKIKTLGTVVIPRGRIVGGETTAHQGVICAQAGSDGSAPTLIVAGEDYTLTSKIAEKEALIKPNQEQIDKIQETLLEVKDNLRLLTPKKREVVTHLALKVTELNGLVERIREEIKDLTAESRKSAHPFITVNKVVYPETTVRIQRTPLLVTERIGGPTRAMVLHSAISFQRTTIMERKEKLKKAEESTDKEGESSENPPDADRRNP